MYWNNKLLHLPMSSSTKVMQFLQIMLLRGEQGITREVLAKYLFEGNELSNPSNSLRVTHYRLRKILAGCGLPQCDYIKIKKGVYYWNDEIPFSTDVGEFQKLLQQAAVQKSAHERQRLQKNACRLYKGELLPMLGAEDWVITEGAAYRKAYKKALGELIDVMKENGDYEGMEELARQASRIYPYEEWQIPQIEALISLGEYSRALDSYNKASRLYMDDLGVVPSRPMLELYQVLSEKVKGSAESIQDIHTQIEEQSTETGAFYCNLLSFVDSCRILSRMSQRRGDRICLMLCSLRDTEGDIEKRQKKAEKEMAVLKSIIQNSLRKGDFFTKYSPSQYLIFLDGTGVQQAPVVSGRIRDNFQKQYPVGSVSLLFSAVNLHEPKEDK